MILYDCKKCGAKHGMGIEDMETGNIEPIDYCKECLFEQVKIDLPSAFNLQSEWGGDARCMTSDGRNVNMADELNRIEKDLLGDAKHLSGVSYVKEKEFS